MQRLFFFLLLPVISLGQAPKFNASGILALIDGDMSARSFYQNDFRPATGHISDELISYAFPMTVASSKSAPELPISNSMLSDVSIIEISNSSPRLAFILETKGKRTGTATSLNNAFARGGFVSVVDVSSVKNPKGLFRFEVSSNPLSISLSPDNRYLAVCSEEYENELQIIELDDTGKPVRKIKKPISLGTDRISQVTWHPDGNFLAYSNESRSEVGLIEVIRDRPTQKIIRLQTLGQPVRLGSMPGKGKFTSDGRFYLVPDLKKSKAGSTDTTPAELFVIKFSFDEAGTNNLLSKATVGNNLENVAIHPSNSIVAAVCSNESFYPNQELTDVKKGKLTLMRLRDDGTLTIENTYFLEGEMPSGLQFDQTGTNLAVSYASFYSFGMDFGGIEFWSLKSDGKLSLIQQPYKVYTPTGIHQIKAVN